MAFLAVIGTVFIIALIANKRQDIAQVEYDEYLLTLEPVRVKVE